MVLRLHGQHMAAWQDCAQIGSLHARAALPSTYSAEAIVKLNTAVPGSPGTTSGTQGGGSGRPLDGSDGLGARRAFSRVGKGVKACQKKQPPPRKALRFAPI